MTLNGRARIISQKKKKKKNPKQKILQTQKLEAAWPQKLSPSGCAP